MTPIQKQISDLAAKIQIAFPESEADFTAFPSSAAMLHVRHGEKLFVMAFIPSYQCFGVDEVKDDEGFLSSYKHVFKDYGPAAELMLELLQTVEVPQKMLA